MNEKLVAIEVLEQAIKAVNAAMDAIDSLAEKYDLAPKVKPGETLTVDKLVAVVSSITEKDPESVAAILYTTFHLMRDMDLIIEEKEGK